MCREIINEIDSSFDEIYDWITAQNGLEGLISTGGTPFDVTSNITRDQRRFISLPHSNRVYENDWGNRNNNMGQDGQRIGQYCLPIHDAFRAQN
tara:strand:+ start:72 stop:353 length:282 start_codon:yes stop_codon:yes gene_type:complete